VSIIWAKDFYMDGEIMLKDNGRYIVTIRCKICGDRFTLKGTAYKGKIETGFKRCLCDNESDFDVKKEKIETTTTLEE
jgi:hypothetical protein